MQIYRSTSALARDYSGCVLTIGNFDALHIGHRQIIAHLVAEAKRLQLPAVLMTFDPGPEKYFNVGAAKPRVNNLTTRACLLGQWGIDGLLVLPFNEKMATTSAEDFVTSVLLDELSVRWLLVGDDFRFGQGRKGDFQLLQRMAETHDFVVENTQTINLDKQRVSSSRVRTALQDGDLAMAKQLLGRHYQVAGRVIYGDQRGREWGFPTLNLRVARPAVMHGVFVVSTIIDGAAHQGVANLGVRPTVGGMRCLLEVHLFDFEQSVYGKRVDVHFLDKVRDEQRFADFPALQVQIGRDCEVARQWFAHNNKIDKTLGD